MTKCPVCGSKDTAANVSMSVCENCGAVFNAQTGEVQEKRESLVGNMADLQKLGASLPAAASGDAITSTETVGTLHKGHASKKD